MGDFAIPIIRPGTLGSMGKGRSSKVPDRCWKAIALATSRALEALQAAQGGGSEVTQKELAKAMGTSQNRVSVALRAMPVGLDYVWLLHRHTGLSVDEILGDPVHHETPAPPQSHVKSTRKAAP